MLYVFCLGMIMEFCWQNGSKTITRNKYKVISSHLSLCPFTKKSKYLLFHAPHDNLTPAALGSNLNAPSLLHHHLLVRFHSSPFLQASLQSSLWSPPPPPHGHRLSSFPVAPLSFSLSSMGRLERTLRFSFHRPERDTFMFLRHVCSLKTESRWESS